MSLHRTHMTLIDAVNNATSRREHILAEAKLEGWRQGVRNCGRHVGLIAANFEQFERGHKDRPMCCGVFLDWTPKVWVRLPGNGFTVWTRRMGLQ